MNNYPKIIHQIWLSDKNLPPPDKWKESQEKWKETYSEYEYMLWTNENTKELISKNYSQFEETFYKFKYLIQRVDFLKFILMHHYGGVYSDLDIVPLKRFDNLINTDSDCCITRSEVNLRFYTNSFFIGKPKTKIWMDLMNESVKKSKNNYLIKHAEVTMKTGSWLVTNVVNKYEGTITILPNYFNPVIRDNEYFKSLEGKSWISWDTKILIWLRTNWKWFTLLIIVLVIFILILIFKRKK